MNLNPNQTHTNDGDEGKEELQYEINDNEYECNSGENPFQLFKISKTLE
jgi:hypothetical protein